MEIHGSRWICEYCFRTVGGNILPEGWIQVWGGGVCPECQEKVPRDGGYVVVPGGRYAIGPDPRAAGGKGPEQPLSTQESAGLAAGDLLAAGKGQCGKCLKKRKNQWRCADKLSCPTTAFRCIGYVLKKSLDRIVPPKKKVPPAPPGVKFLYFGRPRRQPQQRHKGLPDLLQHLLGHPKNGSLEHHGVVTVAYSIAERVPLVEIAFSFCSPKDRWCKATGRDMAITRLHNSPITVPYIYSPKRTMHEVVRAILSHDFQRLERLIPGMKAWGNCRVPSWTKDLAERMERKEITASEINRTLGRPANWRPDPTHAADAFTYLLPGITLARILADLAKLER